MDDLKLCEIHYLQGKHRQYKEKVPESLKLQRKRKNVDETVDIDNAETETARAQSEFKMELRKIKKKKRKFSEDSESLTDTPSASTSASAHATVSVRKKTMKQCDTQLDLIRMVLEREVEKRKGNSSSNNKRKKKKKKEIKPEEMELRHYDEGELRKELPNGVMEISPALMPHDYDNVNSHCDVKVAAENKIVAVTPRYFRSKNIDRVAVGKLQVSCFHCLYRSVFFLCLLN